MKPRLLIFALTLLLTLSAAAQTPVQYKSGEDTVTGYLFTPHSQPASGKLPAIIVIHEWYGVVPWVKQQAQKFADQGYVTLAIDLYRGESADTPDTAHELMRALPEDRSARDLRAAFSYLKSRKDVDSARIGSIGWCMGGGYSLKLAELEPNLRAASVNYGAVTSDAATLQPIHASILGIFGGQDRGIKPDDVHAFESKMKSLNKDVQIHIYDDAGHAFQNSNSPNYKPKDADESFQHQTDFFAAKLKK